LFGGFFFCQSITGHDRARFPYLLTAIQTKEEIKQIEKGLLFIFEERLFRFWTFTNLH